MKPNILRVEEKFLPVATMFPRVGKEFWRGELKLPRVGEMFLRLEQKEVTRGKMFVYVVRIVPRVEMRVSRTVNYA